MAIFNTASRAETVALGERLAGCLAPGSLVCFTGGQDRLHRGACQRPWLHRPGEQPHLRHRELLPGSPVAGPF